MFAHNGVIPFREFANEIMRTCQFGRLNNGFDRQSRVRQGDVVAHRAVKEGVFLQDNANLMAQRCRINHGNILSINQHSTIEASSPWKISGRVDAARRDTDETPAAFEAGNDAR